MADLLTHIPEGMGSLIEDIKAVKAGKQEPTTRRAIVIEAIKLLHKRLCK